MPVDLASADLPSEPGVYLFKNEQGRVLYVGKATRLNERIRSYFSSNPDRHMIPELVERADDIECIVTQTPQAALTRHTLTALGKTSGATPSSLFSISGT